MLPCWAVRYVFHDIFQSQNLKNLARQRRSHKIAPMNLAQKRFCPDCMSPQRLALVASILDADGKVWVQHG